MKSFGLRMHSAKLQETCQGDLKLSLSRKQSGKTSWERHEEGFEDRNTLNVIPFFFQLIICAEKLDSVF